MSNEREDFESWYCEDAAKNGFKMTPKYINSLRIGEGYGTERHMLNGKWLGWQARAERIKGAA